MLPNNPPTTPRSRHYNPLEGLLYRLYQKGFTVLTNRQQNILFSTVFIAFFVVLFIQLQNPAACFTSC